MDAKKPADLVVPSPSDEPRFLLAHVALFGATEVLLMPAFARELAAKRAEHGPFVEPEAELRA